MALLLLLLLLRTLGERLQGDAARCRATTGKRC
jgi:hypothetical protein